MIDRANNSEPCVERAQDVGKSNFIKEVDEQISRCRAAIDYEQIGRFCRSEDAVDFAAVFEVDELGFWMESLQCRILVIAVDRAMFDTAIFEILDEIRSEEALSDTAFAVDNEIDLFVHTEMR